MKRALLVALGLLLTVPSMSVAAAPGPQPTCGGRVATLVFPSTSNQGSNISGTEGDDVIVTGAGAETIRGLTGDDTICVRGGPDRIFAGRGDDQIIGGRGRDRLFGGRGLDRARGNQGIDACVAERERGC